MDIINDYDCLCEAGFTGKNCQTGRDIYVILLPCELGSHYANRTFLVVLY